MNCRAFQWYKICNILQIYILWLTEILPSLFLCPMWTFNMHVEFYDEFLTWTRLYDTLLHVCVYKYIFILHSIIIFIFILYLIQFALHSIPPPKKKYKEDTTNNSTNILYFTSRIFIEKAKNRFVCMELFYYGFMLWTRGGECIYYAEACSYTYMYIFYDLW